MRRYVKIKKDGIAIKRVAVQCAIKNPSIALGGYKRGPRRSVSDEVVGAIG